MLRILRKHSQHWLIAVVIGAIVVTEDVLRTFIEY